jgi:type IV pilus biogenesis protein CpaD/CtpE
MLRECLANITNTEMTEKVWQQATLPVSKGGLGIRRTEELALSAFLASVYSVQHVILMIVPDTDMNDITAEPTSKWCEITGQ